MSGIMTIVSLLIVIFVYPIISVVILISGFLIGFCYKMYQPGSLFCQAMEKRERILWRNHILGTISGRDSIRAYALGRQFYNKFIELLQRTARPYYLSQCFHRWLAIRLDFISILLIASTTVLVILGKLKIITKINIFQERFEGNLELLAAVAMIMQVTSLLMFTFRVFGEANTRLTAIENIFRFLENLEEEDLSVVGVYKRDQVSPEFLNKDAEDNRKPRSETVTTIVEDDIEAGQLLAAEHSGNFDQDETNQPKTNARKSTPLLEFQNVTMRYNNNSNPALKNITFKIFAGQKIGIVGRTGSGKSSLAEAILRLTPIENGNILIDGKSQLNFENLAGLRKTIALIPQQPILYSGTIRDNLMNSVSDSDELLLKTLAKVQLSHFDLDHILTDGGLNLSVGQRQLICIARALLQKSKIIIFDEATAAIDAATEMKLQESLEKITKIDKITTLVIAHRIGTIIDSDKILVLDKGRLVEFDNPERLKKKVDGVFCQLAGDL